MTHQKLFIIFLLGLFSCGQTSVKEQATTVDTLKPSHSDSELWTLYLKSDTIYHVKRLVSSNTIYVLLTYDINTSQPEAAYQTFIKKDTVTKVESDKMQSENVNFNWAPFKTKQILFVQLQASAFKDQMAALDKGHQVEQIIDTELKAKNLGLWTAGDIGPGGANMLFEVQNVDKAKDIIRAVLVKEGLDKVTLIGRRLNTAANDWFYEVIYPLDYNGMFVTM